MDTDENLKGSALVADRVFDHLLERILTGELAGGSRLRIREIADEVGTSAMPVRDAIRRLSELGLAATAPHRGAVVRTFTVTELIKVYEVRALLEPVAAVQGVAHISGEVITEMRAALNRMRECISRGDVSAALGEDEKIHRLTYVASGNEVIVEMIEALWLRCRPYKYLGAIRDRKLADATVWNSQEPFIDAVAANNPHTAAGIIVDSLHGAQRRLEESLKKS